MREATCLEVAGCCVVLDQSGPGVPRVLHWGRALGPLTAQDVDDLRLAAVPPARGSSFDQPTWLSLLPVEADGWLGAPAISGHRDGRALLPRLVVRTVDEAESQRLVIESADDESGVAVRTSVALGPTGVLRIAHRISNTADGTLDLTGLLAQLPLPGRVAETLDLGGRWIREAAPQRGRLDLGSRVREQRHGRTGHDTPLLLAAGTTGFGFRQGEVWAMHVAWSGDTVWRVGRLGDPMANAAAVLGGGELLRPGEIRLEPGDSYETPPVVFVWSGAGLDGISERLHQELRARPSHPRSPRPVVLNTWEAVYHDHDLEKLTALTEVAAEVGVERFVLDDGWFHRRADDRAGLGDWFVDADVWPDGLHPLVDRVRVLGMDFGLWVEPEMINLDSDLARAHPEWLLAAPGRLPLEWRFQHVLDLARPEVFAYLLERLDALVTEYDVAYLKWDHNRDLVEAVHAPTGRAGVHGQTAALYVLIDELRSRHPGLEIESCASGGGRIDLGILERTDRVWASDTNDPVERQQIQRWLTLVVPPELVGSHLGGPAAHTTGRVTDLGFRAITALFGHLGFEWNLTTCSIDERAALTRWVALYKELRGLLHSGNVVRAEYDDPGISLHGVVAPDGREGAYAAVRLTSSPAAGLGRIPLPGLDPRRRYEVRLRGDAPGGPRHAGEREGWWGAPDGVLRGVPGSVLSEAGIQLPTLHPGQGALLQLRSIG